MSEHFDVCVLGGQPAGFLLAALLAKKGLRTAVIDHGEGFDTYRQGGVNYPLFPQPLIGLRGFKFADTLLEELGAQVDLPRRYMEAKPSLQVIYPRHRLDLNGTNGEMLREAKREFADAGDQFGYALESIDTAAADLEQTLASEPALPEPGFFKRFFQARRLQTKGAVRTPATSSRVFSTLPADHPLGQLLLEATRFSTHIDNPNMPVGVLGMLAQRTLAGSVRLDGNGGSYFDILSQLVTNAGGVVRRGTLVDNLTADSRRITGLETAGSSKLSLGADFFVSALFSHQLWQAMPQSRTLQKLIEQNSRLRARTKMYFHHMLIKEDGLPLGLGDNVLLMNGRKQARAGEEPDAAIWVTIRRGHSKEHALLSAAIEVRESEASSLPEQLTLQRKRVRKQLERLMPFLPPFIVAESSPMAQSEWDAHEGGARKLDPWLLHPRFEPLPDALLGVTGLPFHTPYKNLLRVGRETLPSLGSLGDFISARMAANIILASRKK